MTAVDPSAATAAEDGRPAAAGAPGQSLGKYRLDRVIGSGGMGIVWAAFDPDLERAVALKLLRYADSETTLRSRLLREARAMARLKHPSVLTVYEVGTDANRDYIAMELVDGDNLSAWLDTKPARPEILAALRAAGHGLAAAHAGGLVHRDFKPHNVLRSKDGHVYVTDFGLARGQIELAAEIDQKPVTALPDHLASGSQPRRPHDSVLDSPLTQTGVMIGTPAYMAPEQFAGKAPDPRSDQFAFCVTAWEALTGARPFRGATLEELERAAGGGVQAIVVDLPPRLRAVLERGLDPVPANRWPDMPALLAALDDAIAPPRATSRRVWYAGLALTVLAAGGAAVAFVATSRPARTADAPAAECSAPDHAFDAVWSDAKRAAFARVHGSADPYGAGVLLDTLRNTWVSSFRIACQPPRTAARTAQLACLMSSRREAEQVVARVLDPQALASAEELGKLIGVVTMCGADYKMRDLRIPIPPTPPTPVPDPPTGEPALDIEVPEIDTDGDTDKDSDDGSDADDEEHTKPPKPPKVPKPPKPPKAPKASREP